MSDDVPSVAKLPTKWGQFDIHVYHEEETGLDHVALMLGRTPHELLSVESNEGEYVFLIEVKANE